MKSLIAFVGLFILLFASVLNAGELVFASGAEGGSYSAFFNQIRVACSDPSLTEIASSGSVENIKNLTGNKANVGIVQEDILWARKLIDDDSLVDGLKTLLVLYPEEVHVIALARSNIAGFSKLGNKKIASFGGSIITSKILINKTRIRISGDIIEAPNRNAALDMLDKGKVEAVVAVGGQPMDWVASLPNKFKLVPFDLFQAVNTVYTKAVLSATSYPNLTREGIPTISTWSLLVTKDYKTDGKIADISSLYNCIVGKLPELVETTGNHPKWELVKADNKTTWPIFDKIQKAKTTSPAPAPKVLKKK